MSNGTIIGTILNVTERGEYRTVLVQREAADKYEQEHADKTVIPFDLSPYLFKKNGVAGLLKVGTVVAVTFRLTGREYNGKRYLSAGIDSIEGVAGAAADVEQEQAEAESDAAFVAAGMPGAVTTDPTGAAPDGQAEDAPLPF
jgi:hypothetical protein